MASNYASVKLSAPFVEEARREAETVHRSLGAQVEYWAKLGRAFESTPGVDLGRIRDVLEGRRTLEDLLAEDPAKAAAEMGAFFDNPGPEVEAYYAALGAREGAVGRDEKGRLVRRQASGRLRVIG
ncbi:MAG: hypothetical protein ABW360_01640 [Phenylobacterium sp.]